MAGKEHKSFIIALLVALILVPSIGLGQELCDSASHRRIVRTSIPIDFRQSDSVINPNYANNSVALHNLDSIINEIKTHEEFYITSLEVFGTVSPEGSARFNRRLSKGRVRALEKYITERIEVPDSVIEHREYIDWKLFREVMANGNDSPYCDAVIKIIDTNYPRTKDWDGSMIDGRIIALRKLQGGRVWQQLIAKEFKLLRSAGATFNTSIPIREEVEVIEAPEEVIENIEVAVEPEVAEVIINETPEPKFRPMLSVKLNGAAVPLMLVNAGFELGFAKQWSLDLMGVYSPYNYFKSDRKVRLLAMQPEVRYWFGETMKKGHFIGLHAPMGGFNLQMGDTYRYQDPNRMAWGVGVSYGYALPMSKKNDSWVVEFTIGVGYVNIIYDVYEGVHNGKYLRTEQRHYIGPTRLGINFAYRFDFDKEKKQKKSKSVDSPMVVDSAK